MTGTMAMVTRHTPFEYTPGASGDISWFVGENPTWKVSADALGPNGNVGQRIIPEEPMAVVMNFGMSTGFSSINFTHIARFATRNHENRLRQNLSGW